MSYEGDAYKEVYSRAKLSPEEIRQFNFFKDCSDAEVNEIAEKMFDLAVIVKIIMD